jgi:hypothetical protein
VFSPEPSCRTRTNHEKEILDTSTSLRGQGKFNNDEQMAKEPRRGKAYRERNVPRWGAAHPPHRIDPCRETRREASPSIQSGYPKIS